MIAFRQYQTAVEQFNGREGKTRTLFHLPACVVFCPTSAQPFGGLLDNQND
jgi:hypothetical protein